MNSNLRHANHTVYVGAGSNMANRLDNLRKAVELLNRLPRTSVKKTSAVYLSEPLGFSSQGWFYNAVFELRSALKPETFLVHCKRIECLMGRPADHMKWGPRIIDLDILLYDDSTCSQEHLTIPHPELSNRKFVLLPLLDLANPTHPLLGKTMRELLETCPDTSSIERTGHTLLTIS
ncbi:MAG: 2-amino-4-hydroxy-6-hydroxymethyldihydropteridine diphosphokinase [Chlorobium sp.]|nr:2-amino-4-hydroxy-6-hydroxymethyldihydropteridine diphosphokinase [Chlorobium sp.]